MTVSSKEDICNIALGRIQVKRITSLSGTDPTSVFCSQEFDAAFEALLEERDWNFATRRAEITGLIPITGATQADPVVITSAGHGLADGTKVGFTQVEGMVELNLEADPYVVANATADTFELNDEDGNTIDGTAFSAYTSGGYVYVRPDFEYACQMDKPANCLHVIREYSKTEFRVEGEYILSNADTLQIEYIEKITDMSKCSPLFVDLLAWRLAASLAVPLRGSNSLADKMDEKARKKLARAKKRDSQEGTRRDDAPYSWEDERFGD